MVFEDLGIDGRLMKTLKERGFIEPTDIQRICIPEIKAGRDVFGQSSTGSGKTLAFALPILEKLVHGNGIQALVLTPTRELCLQVAGVFSDFGLPLGIKTATVYGGVDINPQIDALRHADVVVGTPGRVIDHLERKTIFFGNVRYLVLDEADKMFEMGFIEDVEYIIGFVPKERQTLLFSATITSQVHEVMNKHLKTPEVLTARTLVDAKLLKQVYYDIYNQNEKFSLLTHLLKTETSGFCMIFCATRNEVDAIAENLKRYGVNATAIHGGHAQNKRERSLDALKTGEISVLVATDVAARGLDIKNISHIYNYDVPKTDDEYIHRIGRTARAGESGTAVTLLTKRDHDNFRKVLANPKLNVEKASMPQFPLLSFYRGYGRHSGGFGGGGRFGSHRGRPGGGRFHGRGGHSYHRRSGR